MLITLKRVNKTEDGIFGTLDIDQSSFKCVTLENREKAIPAGIYVVKWMWSEHFQQVMPHLIVPDRTAIEIHWANYPMQLLGCIAVGTEAELIYDAISESKSAWIGFVNEILNQIYLTIKIVEDFA